MSEYQKIEEYLTEEEKQLLDKYCKPFDANFVEKYHRYVGYYRYDVKNITSQDEWIEDLLCHVCVSYYEREYLMQLISILCKRLGVELLGTALYFQEKKGLKR